MTSSNSNALSLPVLSSKSEDCIQYLKNIASSLRIASHHASTGNNNINDATINNSTLNNNNTANSNYNYSGVVPSRDQVKGRLPGKNGGNNNKNNIHGGDNNNNTSGNSNQFMRYCFDCDDVCVDTLRVIGEEVSNLIATLEASLEEHFVGFFSHVNKKHEQELSLWVRGTIPTSASTSTISARNNNNNNNVRAAPVNNQAPTSVQPSPNSNSGVVVVADVVQRDLSSFALQSWLMIELESLVAQMNVTRAAVYLKDLDNSDFLKLAAAVPKASTYYYNQQQHEAHYNHTDDAVSIFLNPDSTTAGFDKNNAAKNSNNISNNNNNNATTPKWIDAGIPKEISSASHSVLTTVVNTGVGASITRKDRSLPSPRGELPFDKMMCLPLFASSSTSLTTSNNHNDDDQDNNNSRSGGSKNQNVVGCVVVTEKKSGEDFDTVDELRLWGFAQSACGVLQRYSAEWFVPALNNNSKNNSTSSTTSVSNSRKPKSGDMEQLQDQIWATLDSAASLPRITSHIISNNNNNNHNANTMMNSPSSQGFFNLDAPGFGRRKQFGNGTVPTNNTGSNNPKNQQQTRTHQKVPFIRTGTVMEAAKNKQRISSVAGSSNFASQKNLFSAQNDLFGRSNNNNSSSSGSAASNALIPTEMSHEEVIESVAPYLRNLEGLWRRALDECARMKNEATHWRAQVDVKEAKIIELEVALRHLTRQMNAMQVDVEAIRKAVPEGLALANLAKSLDV